MLYAAVTVKTEDGTCGFDVDTGGSTAVIYTLAVPRLCNHTSEAENAQSRWEIVQYPIIITRSCS